MIDRELLRRLGWSDELIDEVGAVAAEHSRVVAPNAVVADADLIVEDPFGDDTFEIGAGQVVGASRLFT